MEADRSEQDDHRRKKKVKRREGKSKDESERRSSEEAIDIGSAADVPTNSEEKAVMGIQKEEKKKHKSKKDKGRHRKEKKNNVDGSVDSGSTEHGVGKEQPSSEHVEGDTSNGSHSERGKGEGEQPSKSKKIKRKRNDGEPAADGSAGDEFVTRQDKKRKKEHSVVLEQSTQIDITKTGEKKECKKKRKENAKISPDLNQNASAGGDKADVDGKNDKKKKKSKEGSGGEKREKEKATQSKDKGKRVSFADTAEVFSIEDSDDKEGGSSDESNIVHGQRFTPEEDTTLLEAIKDYAEMKQLGEKGLEMIRASRKHPELKGCWADIAKCLPHRPQVSIYKRARILLYRSDERKWTPEEYEKIQRYVEKNGTEWKALAQELEKSDIHVKDTWRRIKPKNLKKGQWTQEEQQNLFDLVNLDLRLKARQEKDDSHRVIRDNISWEAISDKMTTRSHKNCCLKWYNTLASPLVKQGLWADIDDYRLVEALEKVDAVCVEDVDWDSLLDHRSGEVCRQRWNQMVRAIGDTERSLSSNKWKCFQGATARKWLNIGNEEFWQ